MKYIKIFENCNDKPNFDVGDTVLVNGHKANIFLSTNKKYIIEKIYIHDNGTWYCNIKGINKNEPIDFCCSRFISEVEYNANKYNL